MIRIISIPLLAPRAVVNQSEKTWKSGEVHFIPDLRVWVFVTLLDI
jgi:hypothetical protein